MSGKSKVTPKTSTHLDVLTHFKDIAVIEINDKKYCLQDYATITQRQQKIFRRLYSKYIRAGQAAKQDEMNISDIFDIMDESEYLALIYLEENETKFKLDTYKKRIIAFGDMEFNDEKYHRILELLADFFTLKMSSILKSIHIYSGKIPKEITT